MKESLNPTNVTELTGGGIDSLRAKSGIGERQVTKIAGEGDEAARDIASIDRSTDELNAAAGFNAADTSPLMSKIENRISGMRDETEAATGIMASVNKGDLPGKTASAREFLINTLKVGDEYPATTLNDVISAEDMKYIFEGGGGAMGDPLVLVQKYFGPRIAELLPTNASSEEMVIFTRKIMDNVEDVKGFKPDEPEFDALTATIVEPLADGGRAGFRSGGFSILGSNNMTDAVIRRIEALMDEGLDFGSAYKQITKEVPVLQKKDGGRIDYAKGGLAKILEL